MEMERIVEWNIIESKRKIKKAIMKDKIIILFTRVLEDLTLHKNPNFYGRVKEAYTLIHPYYSEEDPKKILMIMMKMM